MFHALFELAVGFLPKPMQTAYTAIVFVAVAVLLIAFFVLD